MTPNITGSLGRKALLFALTLSSCRATQVSETHQAQPGEDDDTVTIGFSEPLHTDASAFISALRGEGTVTANQLSFIDQLLPVKVSTTVSFATKQDKIDIYDYKSTSTITESYRAIDAGGRLLVMKKTGTDQSGRDVYRLFDSMPATYLQGKTLEQRTRYYLDAKYYERDRIANINEMLDSAEFVFNFIPGYAGANDLFYGTEDQRLMGVVQIVGDVATLGLGSKVMAVKRAAVGVVLTASAARIGNAVHDASQGRADMYTGIDVALASFEAGLAAFTMVKIKIGPSRGFVDSPSAAQLLSRKLGRSADDIKANGLSRKELESLIGDVHVPAVAKMKIKNPCGLGLTAKRSLSLAGGGLCHIRNPAQPVTQKEAEAVFNKLNSKRHLFHYTDEQGIFRIGESAKIKATTKGKVYVTNEALTQKETFEQLFIASERYKDRGSHVVIFERSAGDAVETSTAFRRTSDRVTPEFTHNGAINLNQYKVLYIGPNPFDLL